MLARTEDAPARRVEVSAWIDADDGCPWRHCMIESISAAAARIIIPDPFPLPENFLLRLTPTGKPMRHCVVVCRDHGVVEIRFVFDKAGTTPIQPVALPPLQETAKDQRRRTSSILARWRAWRFD